MMLSKIIRDHVKNLAFVASTRLECPAKRNERGLERRFRRKHNWGDMFRRDHVKIGRDQRFRCALCCDDGGHHEYTWVG